MKLLLILKIDDEGGGDFGSHGSGCVGNPRGQLHT